eukprot:UC4_evm3s1505
MDLSNDPFFAGGRSKGSGGKGKSSNGSRQSRTRTEEHSGVRDGAVGKRRRLAKRDQQNSSYSSSSASSHRRGRASQDRGQRTFNAHADGEDNDAFNLFDDSSNNNNGGFEGNNEEAPNRYHSDEGEDQEEENFESAVEKRVRLAKEYISRVSSDIVKDFDDEGDDDKYSIDGEGPFEGEPSVDIKSKVSGKLHDEMLSKRGKLFKHIASGYSPEAPSFPSSRIFSKRSHRLSVTCVTMTGDGEKLYTGAKDCTIIAWSFPSAKKVAVFPRQKKGEQASRVRTGHADQVLSIAVTTNGRYLASGGKDNWVLVWDTAKGTVIRSFRGHRGSITGLATQIDSLLLYSCSEDKSIKIWNLENMTYVDTLFGHEDAITNIDCLYRERIVTSGSRDRSVRIWKIPEESQLVFQASKEDSSLECVRMIDDQHMLSGSLSGSLALWDVTKKKPLYTLHDAHGTGNWISAVASFRLTDLASSGAADGTVKVWQIHSKFRGLSIIFNIDIPGIINDMLFSPDGSRMVLAVGQEPRLGRWFKHPIGKNALFVVKLEKKE